MAEPGQAAVPTASQGHGRVNSEAGAGETALSHPTAASARRWGCGEAALALSVLRLPARLAPQPALPPLPLRRLQAG